MSTARLLLALDAGTTGVRAVIFDDRGRELGLSYEELRVTCAQPGWAETDAIDLWNGARRVIAAALRAAAAEPASIAAVGVANQRASTVVWEKATGRPVHPAILWQDVRTASRVAELQQQGVFASVMASATKLEWILAQTERGRQRGARGEILFGTIDSWLVWNLTGGRLHVTDPSNASCTGLYDYGSGGWDASVLDRLDVPAAMLPSIVPSSGALQPVDVDALGFAAPVAAIAGDQQASMFGLLRLRTGDTKITLGTSAIVEVNTGDTLILSQRGAYPLVLWAMGEQRPYCLEGSAITAGAAVQWLRDGLGVIADAAETAELARQVNDNGGVWVVPAFQGLGTPHVQPEARAVIGGLSRASTKAHVVRAMLEGIAFRCAEIVLALAEDLGTPPPALLRTDGGAAQNDFLLQQIADAIGIPVERPMTIQGTALGAALLAGLGVGVWADVAEISQFWKPGSVFEPTWDASRRATEYGLWRAHLDTATADTRSTRP